MEKETFFPNGLNEFLYYKKCRLKFELIKRKANIKSLSNKGTIIGMDYYEFIEIKFINKKSNRRNYIVLMYKMLIHS